MKYIEKNGYKISEFTLGTVQLGIPYGINNKLGMPNYEQSADILKTATDAGVISFDTAKGYGKSEAVIGKFFSENSADKTIITKVEFDNERPDEIKDSLFHKVKDSAKVMNLSKVPVVLLHSEGYIEKYGKVLIDALRELKAEGLVDSVGISFSDKSRLMELTDPTLFDSVQIPANMFDNKEIISGEIKKLNDMGISVFVRSIYLQGLFFMEPSALPLKIKSAGTAIKKLNIIAEENNLTMAGLALSYMRMNEGISSLVLGCETKTQLKDSLSLFDLPPLSKSVVNKITEISEEVDPVVIRPWEWNK